MELKDKVVLVTGSTRGIGAQTALTFAKAGCRVILNGRHTLPDDLTRQLQVVNADYSFIQDDLANTEDIQQLATAAWSQYGHIDVLVNNAGINRDRLLIGMRQADFDDVINVNLRGTFMLTQLILKKMMKQRSGAIINLSSVVGLHGNAGQANYAASKAALIGLTKTIAQEGALRNIRCNAVAPGMITSDMTAALTERIQKQMIEKIPLKRFGRPSEIAMTIKFLASNDYITGQTIVVDGGMTM